MDMEFYNDATLSGMILDIMHSKTPSLRIAYYRETGQLKSLLPEVDCLFGVPQNEVWHPEIDVGIHVGMVCDLAAKENDPELVFLGLMHDLGKGITPADILPSHKGHEEAGVPLVEAVCDRCSIIDKDLKRLAVNLCRQHLLVHKAFELTERRTLALVTDLGGLHSTFQLWADYCQILRACELDARGRKGLTDSPYPQRKYLIEVAMSASRIIREHKPHISRSGSFADSESIIKGNIYKKISELKQIHQPAV